MSLEQNKAVVRRYQDAYNANELDALDGILAPNLVSHSMLPGVPQGLPGAKLVHQGLLVAFPDQHTVIDDLIAEGDKVVMRFTVSGTHKGPLMGIPATGKGYSVPGVSIFRLAEGKIVEHWGVFDQMAVMQQLGLAPSPSQA
jgi:steroid delta-isomerase-like uncharacterized protein